jgi:hypothetical protein
MCCIPSAYLNVRLVHVITPLTRYPWPSQFLGVCLSRLATYDLGRHQAVEDTLGYATKADSDVYHLVYLKLSRTLCGLPTNGNSDSPITLIVNAKLPDNGKLCRHCDDAADANRESITKQDPRAWRETLMFLKSFLLLEPTNNSPFSNAYTWYRTKL